MSNTEQLERYRTALELVGYREPCHDSEAEEMRQIARDAVGMNSQYVRDRLYGEKGTP